MVGVRARAAAPAGGRFRACTAARVGGERWPRNRGAAFCADPGQGPPGPPPPAWAAAYCTLYSLPYSTFLLCISFAVPHFLWAWAIHAMAAALLLSHDCFETASGQTVVASQLTKQGDASRRRQHENAATATLGAAKLAASACRSLSPQPLLHTVVYRSSPEAMEKLWKGCGKGAKGLQCQVSRHGCCSQRAKIK